MKLLKAFDKLFRPTADEGVQVWECEVYADGDDGVIVTKNGRNGGKMTEHTDRVTAGKNVGRKNETTPIQQALADAENEWTMKQRRKGYALQVEDSKRFEGPMLAQRYDKHFKKVDWANAWMQPKLDGFRCLAKRTESGIILSSREFGLFTLPHLEEALSAQLKPGETLDGELYADEHALNSISSLVKNVGLAGRETLKLYAYDTVQDGAAYSERLANIAKIGDRRANEFLEILAAWRVHDEAALMKYQAQCIESGYEGAMLRHGSVGYEAGIRSYSLLKVKTFKSGEFVVIGCKEGRGDYKGAAIFRCKTKTGAEFDCTSPGSMLHKRHYWLTHKFFVGCPLTIKYPNMTATDNPVPFQPVAKGFKDGPKLKEAHKKLVEAGFSVDPPGEEEA